ncbi:MAG: TIGR04282 family arsenosugar biosynthesis glycosyltransferase [Halocynthiibacter sp.]
MLKEPRAGRVKTRLGQGFGMIGAAWWYRHHTSALLRRLDDPRWQLILAVSPDNTGPICRAWPGHLARLAQGPGDLGARMARIARILPKGPVLIIGADIPAISRVHIAAGFRALGNHDAVFGPATDGGFWAFGLKRLAPVPPRLFQGVRWSGPHALADSRATLAGARVALLATLQDVDTAADLAKVTR